MMHECRCREPGFCEHHQRMKVGRQWDICNHQVLTPERCRAYWCLWERNAGRECDVEAAALTADAADRRSSLHVQDGALSCLHRGSLLRNEPRTIDLAVPGLVQVYSCARHGECALQPITYRANTKICSTCEERVPIVKINADAHGFGDAVVTAWIAEGAKAGPVRVVHYATGQRAELLSMMGQEVDANPRGAVTTFTAYSEELASTGNPPRVFQRGAYLGIPTPPKRPVVTLATDDLAVANTLMQSELPVVLLFPHTMYRSREWPPFYWIDLCGLINRRNFGVRVVVDVEDERYAHLPGYVSGLSWGVVAAMMRQAACVVANDSAPAHVAGTIGAPTLALLGPSQPSMFIHCESVKCLQVSREECFCSGCYFHAPFSDAVCSQGCVALSHLAPETVMEAICEIA